MRKKLLAWMEAVNDTDLLPEFKAVVRDGGVTEQTPRGEGYLNKNPAEPVAEKNEKTRRRRNEAQRRPAARRAGNGGSHPAAWDKR